MDDNPNILIVSVDSLRQDFCSFFGAEGTTPNLDSLAEQSTVYTNAIAPSTWTLPVHISVFSGLYPTEHQVMDSEIEIGNHPTLGEILRDAGYDTRSFGRNKWLEQGGMLRGFDHTTSPQPMAEAEGVTGKANLYSRWLRRLFFRHQPIDEVTVQNAIDSLDDTEEPYCRFVHLNCVHYIYNPPAPYHRLFANRSTLSLIRNLYQQKRLFIGHGGVLPGREMPPESFVEGLKELYRGCVRYADSLVQELLAAARSSDRDTIVVVFGDHGDNFGIDGMFGHQFSVADSLVRVPLLIHDPTGRLSAGKVDDIVQLNDIYPTLLGIVGETPPKVNSRDLARDTRREMALVYTNPPQTHVDKVRSHTPASKLPPETQILGWVSPDEKFVWYPDHDEPLDRIDGELPEKLQRMLDSLSPVETVEGHELSDSAKENLKQLGYI